MVIVLLGLAGALVYGAADFLGGLAAKRMSVLLTTAVAAVAGLVVLALATALVPGAWSIEAVAWGALSGVTGSAAVALLYACLAIGPMSILSPLTAVVSAIVPVTWGVVLGGERLGPPALAAIGLALVAVVLVGFVPEKGAVRPTTRGLAMAVASGALIGAFFILIDRTPDDSGVVPLLLNRGVNASIMFAAFAVAVVVARSRARSARPAAGRTGSAAAVSAPTPGTEGRVPSALRTGVLLAAACGLLDSTANVIILFGLRAGELSVMSVLIALYPAGTILLAAVVLRERIARVQWLGLVLALAAAGILAVV